MAKPPLNPGLPQLLKYSGCGVVVGGLLRVSISLADVFVSIAFLQLRKLKKSKEASNGRIIPYVDENVFMILLILDQDG